MRKKRIEGVKVALSQAQLDVYSVEECLFATSDFAEFAGTFSQAHAVLGQLCALRATDVTIFVRESDLKTAKRFARQYHGRTHVTTVPENTLLLLGQMVIEHVGGRTGLYTCDDQGFTFLDQAEGLRIRRALREHL